MKAAQMEAWTYETNWSDPPTVNTWKRSSQVYPNPRLASQAAAEWLAVNAENDCTISVRVVRAPAT